MKGLTILAILLSLLLVFNVFVIGYVLVKPAKVTIVNVPTESSYNDSVVNAKLDAQGAQIAALSVDNTWKADAKVLAVSDLSTKDIYNFLNDNGISIDSKSDIKSVVEKKSTVSSYDADNKDAVIVRELKVYYEPSDSTDDMKAYITVTTEIVDGDVEDTSIEFS